MFLHLDAETGVGHSLDRRDAQIRLEAELLGEPTTLYALKVCLRLLPQIQCECRVWMMSALQNASVRWRVQHFRRYQLII